VLYQMVRADFFQRTRRLGFLLTLAAALYLAYGIATEKVWIVIGNGYRGVYNSAWIGALTAICASTFLSLSGFYIVKDAVQRDSDTRVGQILAATPMRKTFYAVAKTVSNFAVLSAMVAILMAAAIVIQLLQTEAPDISLWKLWSPFLLITLPAMALTAALALLFEMLPLLRGGVGNVFYFFAWTAGLAVSVNSGTFEPTGLQVLFRSMRAALLKIDPSNQNTFSLTIGGQRAIHTFYWGGVEWTVSLIGDRALWILVAAGIAMLASVFFHRFDPAREWQIKKGRPEPVQDEFIDRTELTRAAAQHTRLTPIGNALRKGRFGQLLVSELRLMLKGKRWWWYAAAGGMLIGQLVSPRETYEGWLVAAWIWPVLMWSHMGARESRNETASLIFSSYRSAQRQLPAVWLAGVLAAILTGGGVGSRLGFSANWPGLAAWLVGALFIPTLALAQGVCFGSGKPFEAMYPVWWYFGPLHQTPGWDFMGTTAASRATGTYLLFTAVLLLVANVGRRVRMAYA